MVTLSKKVLILILFILNAGLSCENDPAFIPQSPPPILVAGSSWPLEGIAIEPGGKTVLTIDGSWDRFRRFTLGTDEWTDISLVAPDDSSPRLSMSGIVVEPGGTTALVTRLKNTNVDGNLKMEGDLIRVDTGTGIYSIIASGFLSARGLILENEGKTALVAEFSQLTRVNLTHETKTPIATFDTVIDPYPEKELLDVAIESPGETALVLQSKVGLWRVNLRTGAKNLLTGTAFSNWYVQGLAFEPSKGRAIVGTISPGSPFCCPKLLQVDLATGFVKTIVNIASPSDVVIEEEGKTVLVATSQGIYRVQLP